MSQCLEITSRVTTEERAALYLASEDNAFVTGIELTVDGGFAQI